MRVHASIDTASRETDDEFLGAQAADDYLANFREIPEPIT